LIRNYESVGGWSQESKILAGPTTAVLRTASLNIGQVTLYQFEAELQLSEDKLVKIIKFSIITFT